MTSPDTCKKCGGLCCKTESVLVLKPQFEAIRKYLLPGTPMEVLGGVLFEINPSGSRCLALDNTGCRIPRRLRPGQCLSFPWLIDVDKIGFMRSAHCPHLGSFAKEPDHDEWKGLAISALISAKMATVAAEFMREKLQGDHS